MTIETQSLCHTLWHCCLLLRLRWFHLQLCEGDMTRDVDMVRTNVKMSVVCRDCWRLSWNVCRDISCLASTWDAVWKVTEKSLGFFTCSIPSLFGTAVVGNNPKTEILSESIYIISDDAVLKMIRYTDTCRLLSLCLSQPVKQCRVMNNNAGKLFHYRITVSPPTNFLVSLFFLLRTLK